MNKRSIIIVIGSSGFIGREFVKKISKNYRVLSFDKKNISTIYKNETFYNIDLGLKEDVNKIINILKEYESDIKAIYFLAAYYDFSNLPNSKYKEVYYGFCRIVDFHHSYLAESVKFIYSASMVSIKPTVPGKKQNEESQRAGLWEYPAWKLKMEQYLEAKQFKHPCYSLVLAAVYSDQVEIVPLYHMIKNISERNIERFFFPGPTDRGLTYIHVDDVSDLFVHLIKIENLPRGYHRYLVGEEEPLTYKELHEMASKIFLNKKSKIIKVPKWLAFFGAIILGSIDKIRRKKRFIQPWMIKMSGEHFEFDISKIKNELKWSPTYRIKTHLSEILENAEKNYDNWKKLNDLRPW